MTLPHERTRSLLWAGGFLIELARDESLPLNIRRRAVVIARHFPTYEDIAHLAIFRHSSGLGVGLEDPNHVDLGDCCKYGLLLWSTKFAWPEDPGVDEVGTGS